MKHKRPNKSKTSDFDEEFNHDSASNKKWYEEFANDPKDFAPITEQLLVELKDEARRCLASDVSTYNIKKTSTNSSQKWMTTVMLKGTLSDKIAAHVVTIQNKPLCTLDLLQNLVNMVKVGKKKECFAVIDTLSELFLNDLLRPDHKLKSFNQRPLSLLNDISSGNALARRKLLSVWYFEDQLKELYVNFVFALNKVAHDVLDANKEKAITAMFKLLCGNPEQEKNLLSFLVNKLGDPSQKIASKAIYSLGQLLFQHPNMQGVVLNEVEKLLYRPNVSTRAQYYSLCFLSQFYLSEDTREVARRLVQTYFSFFKACIKKGEVDSRMMSALLMGVNRAYPYAKLETDDISDHVDTMYRVVYVANFNNSLHSLNLLHQIADNNITDRFYSALYKKLIDPKLFTTTHQAMLLSLIYKTLLKDEELARVKSFIKRLLQLALYMQPSFACGVLYLVSQLMGQRPNVQSLILKESPEGVMEDEEEKYYDVEAEVDPDVRNGVEVCEPETKQCASQSSWFHCANVTTKNKKGLPQYSSSSRNPLHAGGEFCAYTELISLKNHFHPTVSLYSSNLLEGNVIKYSGDPLKDFTLIRFLDRFVFKNPKKIDESSKRGVHPTFGKRKNYRPMGLKSLAVNSANYLKENLSKIPVDELFLYSYLHKKYKDKQVKEKDDDDDSDLESVKSEEFEEMLVKMGSSKEDERLDYLHDIGDSLREQKKKHKKTVEGSDQDMSDSDGNVSSDEEEDEISEEDLSMTEDDRVLLNDLDDEDEELVFDEEDEKSKTGKMKNELNDLFASADEFASILEDEGSSKIAPGSSNEFAGRDNANTKQIAWEEKRNMWLTGYNKAIGKKMKKRDDHKRKRNNQTKIRNNAKKAKRY